MARSPARPADPELPGDVIKRRVASLLPDDKMRVTTAADALGIAPSKLNDLMRGNTAITPDIAIRLWKVLGGDASMWLGLQAAHDLARAERALAATYEALKPLGKTTARKATDKTATPRKRV